MTQGKLRFIRSLRYYFSNNQFRPVSSLPWHAQQSASFIRKQNRCFSTTPRNSSVDNSAETSTSSTGYDDWYSPAEYESPWESSSSWLQPLSFPHLDYQSRHIIQLVQELYKFGCPMSKDRVTTARCNHILKSLDELATPSINIVWRALAILETMQLFEKQYTKPKSTTDTPIFSAKIPLEIPKPNQETYSTILHILSKTPCDTRELADTALSLVKHMQQLYETTGNHHFQPQVRHWNRMLLAWTVCTLPGKAVHATIVLLEEMAPIQAVDAMSLSTVLQMCSDEPDENMQSIGAQSAASIWDALFEGDNNWQLLQDMPSELYALFLKIVKSMPQENDGVERRAKCFDECFGKACQHGKVNQSLLHEFMTHVDSQEVFNKHLKQYKSHIVRLSVEEASHKLMDLIPIEWTQEPIL